MDLFPRDPEVFRRPSVQALLVVNLFPLVGVLFLGWDLFTLISIYWLETAVIGFYTLVKIGVLTKTGAFFMVPFFIVHMGGFMGGHWLFLSFLFGPGDLRGHPIGCLRSALANPEVLWMIVFLLVSHGISFFTNFWREPVYRNYDPNDAKQRKDVLGSVIFEPYGRIVVMHVAIIVGAMPSLMFGSSRWFFAILVLLKTVADLNGHLKLHGKKR